MSQRVHLCSCTFTVWTYSIYLSVTSQHNTNLNYLDTYLATDYGSCLFAAGEPLTQKFWSQFSLRFFRWIAICDQRCKRDWRGHGWVYGDITIECIRADLSEGICFVVVQWVSYDLWSVLQILFVSVLWRALCNNFASPRHCRTVQSNTENGNHQEQNVPKQIIYLERSTSLMLFHFKAWDVLVFWLFMKSLKFGVK